MREFAHPPTVGARREIAEFGKLAENSDQPRLVRELVIRCETIQKCGLIAEIVTSYGSVTLYATRRSAKVRRG